jgi:hypothetical protein
MSVKCRTEFGSFPFLRFVITWRQSYKRNFVLKKTKFILNSLTVRNVDLDWATFEITYLKQCAFYDFKTNLVFSKTKFLS